MKLFSHSRILPFLALSFLPAVLALPARAQAARSIYLFNSSFGTGAGVVPDARTGSWGNGTSQNARGYQYQYEGSPALQVTTRSFAEGVRFDLAQPVDPAPYMNNGFVRLRLKFREIGGGAGGFPGMGGGLPGMGSMGGGFPGRGGLGGVNGMMPGMMGQAELVPKWKSSAQFRGRDGALPGLGGGDPRLGGGDPRLGGGMLGGDGGMMPMGPLPQTTFIKELKVTFLRDQGAMTGRLSVNLNSNDNKPDDNGWRLYTLAVKDMTSTPGASGPIRRVVLTSDTEDTFYMAQMALVVETGQMVVSIRTPDKPVGTQVAEIEWKPERSLTLVADVEAGAADPQVEWNFDADNVGNLDPPAVNGGVMGPDGTMGGPGMMPGMGGDPRLGGGDPRLGGGDPRLGGGDPRLGGGGRNPRGQLGLGTPGAMGAPGALGGDGGLQPAFTGPRIDSRGLSAKFTYPNEEQNYRVEVTVTDRSGKKQPVKASILVRIRG